MIVLPGARRGVLAPLGAPARYAQSVFALIIFAFARLRTACTFLALALIIFARMWLV